MVQIEEMFMIKELRSKGMYIKDIAKLTGRDSKTIRKYINTQEHKYKEKSKKESTFDPYKNYILSRMQEGCVNAVVIFEEI